MNDPEKKVTFVFYCYEKESADLKIRLRYDGLQQSTFFREILKMYIDQDPLMLEVAEKIKVKRKTMGRKRITNTKKDYDKYRKLESELDLGLSEEEKAKLFDFIEGGSFIDEEW